MRWVLNLFRRKPNITRQCSVEHLLQEVALLGVTLNLHKLAQSTNTKDCLPEVQQHVFGATIGQGGSLPLWRCKIGKMSKWQYGVDAKAVIEKALLEFYAK
jgi:hypothetical protein